MSGHVTCQWTAIHWSILGPILQTQPNSAVRVRSFLIHETFIEILTFQGRWNRNCCLNSDCSCWYFDSCQNTIIQQGKSIPSHWSMDGNVRHTSRMVKWTLISFYVCKPTSAVVTRYKAACPHNTCASIWQIYGYYPKCWECGFISCHDFLWWKADAEMLMQVGAPRLCPIGYWSDSLAPGSP